MICKKLKLLIMSLMLLLATTSVFAVEEYVSEIYKELDKAFANRSESELNTILSKNTKDRYYYLIENYAEKKIRRLIVNNDYDFAMEAIVIVIEYNLDNETAVEMYSVIADAYEIQKQRETEEEYQRQLELARIEGEKEKQRESVDKEYVTAKNTDSGKAVYVSGKETKLANYKVKGALGMVDLLFLYDKQPDLKTFNYGISLDFNYAYTMGNKSVIGADLFGGFQMLPIAQSADDTLGLLADIDVVAKYAPAAFPNLFFRAGVGLMVTGKSETAVNTKDVADSMITPIVGVKLEKLQLAGIKLDIGADWYAAHIYTENLKFAMGLATNLQFPFAELDKVSLNLNVGLRDKLLIKGTGIENRASLILAIGAENVIR